MVSAGLRQYTSSDVGTRYSVRFVVLKHAGNEHVIFRRLSDPPSSEISGLNETQITHLITTSELVPKILASIDTVPLITTIIYMECPYKKVVQPTSLRKGLRLIPFSQLETLGKTADPSLVGKLRKFVL